MMAGNSINHTEGDSPQSEGSSEDEYRAGRVLFLRFSSSVLVSSADVMRDFFSF